MTCRFVDGSGNALNTMDDGTFFRCGSCTVLANSSAKATLLASPANSWGSRTIPSGALKAGQIIEVDFLITLGTAGTPGLVLYILFGGVTALLTANLTTASGMANGIGGPFSAVRLFARSVGASGSINGWGIYQDYAVAGSISGYFSTSATGAATAVRTSLA